MFFTAIPKDRQIVPGNACERGENCGCSIRSAPGERVLLSSDAPELGRSAALNLNTIVKEVGSSSEKRTNALYFGGRPVHSASRATSV